MPWSKEDERPLVEHGGPLAMLLHQQHGTVSRRQALRYLTPAAVRHQLRTGRWRSAYAGVYVTRSGEVTPTQRGWAAVLAAGGDSERASGVESACLGGLSALLAHGLRTFTSPAIHVLVPHDRRRVTARGVELHRTRSMPDRDQTRLCQPPATSTERALVDAVAWARSDNEARTIVAIAFQQRLVVMAEVQRAASELLNTPRRDLLLRTAWDSAGGSHSLTELDIIALCRRHRLPEPARQVRRKDRDGRVRYLDIVFEQWRLVVEIDGAHHLNVVQRWDDNRRQNALELDGYLVLRYPAWLVRTEPERVIAEIREALIRQGWRP